MNADASMHDVAVLGAGPAGVAAAVGLARLGHLVHLYTVASRVGIEGASERTLQCLQRLELREAAATVRIRGPRARHWAGLNSINGTEFLIDRSQFDQALLRDATRAGVMLVSGRAHACETRDGFWSVKSDLAAPAIYRTIVDASGRRVRGFSHRGPALLASTQRFAVIQGQEPGTSIVMGDDCWCWYAQDGMGTLELQMVCAPVRAQLTGGAGLPTNIAALLEGATPAGAMRVRAAGAFLRPAAEIAGRIRAGDAAMALDPLSGHGIYEALASAGVTVAAINTYLRGGEWQMVREFVHERAQELWSRKAHAALSFYEQAAASRGAGFWSAMSQGYAALAAQTGLLHDPAMRIQSRPVLNGSCIEMRRVLVGPQWPRGIWRYGDIEIAALLECCQQGGWNVGRAAATLSRSQAAVQDAMQWLNSQGALPAGGASGFKRTEPLVGGLARSTT